jgi:hypothetical protein
MDSYELKSLKYSKDVKTNSITLSVIDQLKLPSELVYIPVVTSQGNPLLLCSKSISKSISKSYQYLSYIFT